VTSVLVHGNFGDIYGGGRKESCLNIIKGTGGVVAEGNSRKGVYERSPGQIDLRIVPRDHRQPLPLNKIRKISPKGKKSLCGPLQKKTTSAWSKGQTTKNINTPKTQRERVREKGWLEHPGE